MVEDTLGELIMAFARSCNATLTGETPHIDWKGRRLAGGGLELAPGTRGCLVQVRSGWELYALL
eukprot:1102951-Pyramimonas_sp.AAC.1